MLLLTGRAHAHVRQCTYVKGMFMVRLAGGSVSTAHTWTDRPPQAPASFHMTALPWPTILIHEARATHAVALLV